MIGVIKGTMRQKKEVNGLPLPIASYKANLKAPIRSLKVAITAKQSGSGTPAPDNIRPIIGASECNVVRCGVNLCGGETFAKKFEGANGYSIDTTNKTFTFKRSLSNIMPLPFKANTQYTFIFRYTALAMNTSLRITYTDNSTSNITFSENATKTDLVVVSTAGKTIKSLSLGYILDGLVTCYYDECGVFEGTVTTSDFVSYTGNTYTIQLGDTYYGGVLDVTTGVLTVDKVITDLGDINYAYDSTYTRMYGLLPNAKALLARTMKMMCSCFTVIDDGRPVSDVPNNACYNGNTGGSTYVYIKEDSTTDTNAFKTSVTGQKLVYELATPITVQLTPAQVEQLLGANNVWADTGDVEELIYTDRQVYYGR